MRRSRPPGNRYCGALPRKSAPLVLCAVREYRRTGEPRTSPRKTCHLGEKKRVYDAGNEHGERCVTPRVALRSVGQPLAHVLRELVRQRRSQRVRLERQLRVAVDGRVIREHFLARADRLVLGVAVDAGVHDARRRGRALRTGALGVALGLARLRLSPSADLQTRLGPVGALQLSRIGRPAQLGHRRHFGRLQLRRRRLVRRHGDGGRRDFAQCAGQRRLNTALDELRGAVTQFPVVVALHRHRVNFFHCRPATLLAVGVVRLFLGARLALRVDKFPR